MNEHDLRGLLDDVRAGRLSRRAFVRGALPAAGRAAMPTAACSAMLLCVIAIPPSDDGSNEAAVAVPRDRL